MESTFLDETVINGLCKGYLIQITSQDSNEVTKLCFLNVYKQLDCIWNCSMAAGFAGP